MMMREQRAKQFAPFDAMKGLAEALKDREERHSRVQKHGVSEEKQLEISDTLLHVEKGTRVSLQYHANFHDWERTGRVTEINRDYGFFRIDDEKIPFVDLYDLTIIG